MDEVGFDFRPVIRSLLLRRRLIATVGLLIAIPTLVISLLLPPVYTAEASVVIVRLETQVNLQSNIKTTTEKQDTGALRTGLVTLAQSAGVAQDVIVKMGDSLPQSLQQPWNLQPIVGVVSKGNTNLIQISVKTADSKQSQLIATAWANAFVERANNVYRKQVHSEDIIMQVDQARSNYETKQRRLSDSHLDSDVAVLQRRVSELGTVIDAFHRNKTNVVTTTLEREAKYRGELIDLYSSTTVRGQSTSLASQQRSKTSELNALYDTVGRLQRIRDDVRSLRAQLQYGTGAASGPAYILLKAELFASSSNLPTNVQLQLPHSPDDTPTLADVSVLLTNVEDRIKSTQDQINTLSTSLQNGTAFVIPEATAPSKAAEANQRQTSKVSNQQDISGILRGIVITNTTDLATNDQVAALEKSYADQLSELEIKKARFFVLTQERDTAKTAYTALSTRSVEAQAGSAVEDSVVQKTGDAVITRVSRGTIRLTLLALITGLTLAALYVLGRSFIPPLLQEIPTTRLHHRPVSE
ncbi:MAG: hypothetical protein NVS2B7_34580 [Herpetosiphon sp.]